MKMKLTNCKLNKKTQLKLLEFFVLGVTARAAADLLKIHHNSAALFFTKIRKIISYHLEVEAFEIFDGEIELDESYFGGTRKGKRGRGAADKVIVFGLLKRNGKVYTVVVPDTKSGTLMPVISKKITPDSIVYTDQWVATMLWMLQVFATIELTIQLISQMGKIISMELRIFWNQAKRILRKYNGIPKESFPLFLKECEFRFNYGSPSQQLKTLRVWTGI
ncbi:IS1595 family transposase [Acinetobacter sp. YH12049]|uniref:IS1595 family transposase n=1 Tax=Acinetobacter sp. YH12049 TaxID=2601054 RepID=UPI0015D1A337|nr:IS1595 family transposase [Acinetobacter sp. YH12049]